ncbi:MAG: ABC-F family ATP-binding cassette domain-containing protein [Chlamydiae bacterium]|nr:ABC-F family ATP-binding cassette domain-containing protein [Chlamydiota bacterium]
MTTLLSANSLSKSFGPQILFDELSFSILSGDRIGLLGPNGAGKSTLLKILIGQESSDEGSLSKKQSVKIGYASQSPTFDAVPIEEAAVKDIKAENKEEALLRARILLSKAQFTDLQMDSSTLSGGWKKRLDLVRALVNEPNLILLDEPTNHLDLEGILWLEKFLLRERVTLLIVSHDRYFLQNTCNRFFELNRCFPEGIFTSDGDLNAFFERKQLFLEGQLEQERSLKTTLRDEVEWLRRSPKARTTKSQSRVDRAERMIEELSHLKERNKKPKVKIQFSTSERATHKLITGHNLTKSLGGKPLFQGIDILLSPGVRMGIVGKNGTGKTTLLKILAQQIPLDKGTVKYADNLKVVYFDQHREQIPLHLTLKEALCESGDTVYYQGQQIHVNSWAARFLFTPDRLMIPLHCLSGGERARILIAKLMLKPADVLFLDEPTNDLDIPTLEVLEDSLKSFPGAVVLISHDRCLMDNTCTTILSLGGVNDPHFYSGYSQWEKGQVSQIASKTSTLKEEKTSTSARPKKLSYHEQKELEGMGKSIEEAEKKLEILLQASQSNQDPSKAADIYHQLSQAQEILENLFIRWQELENKSQGLHIPSS